MTIYDIAKEAGVSASTVSRVINNKSGIKASTKRKVEKLITKYDFKLNENAKSLITKESKLVAIFVSDIRLEHHNTISYEISKKLLEMEYLSVVINIANDFSQINTAINILRQRQIAGMIFIGSIFETPLIREIITKYFISIPIIMTNGYFDLPNVYSVIIDDYNGSKDGVNFLYSKQYKKIAFIGNLNTKSNKEKVKGYIDGLSYNKKQTTPLIIDTYKNNNTLFEIDKMFEENLDIDSIMFSDDFTMFKYISYLMKFKKDIPNELGLMGYNDDLIASLNKPKFTTINNKINDIVNTTVDTFLSVLKNEERAKRVVLLTEIIERETTK